MAADVLAHVPWKVKLAADELAVAGVQRSPVCYQIVGQHSVNYGTSLSQLKDNVGTVLTALAQLWYTSGTTFSQLSDNF